MQTIRVNGVVLLARTELRLLMRPVDLDVEMYDSARCHALHDVDSALDLRS